MDKYKCGQLICSRGNRGLVFKVVNMNSLTYSLKVVKDRHLQVGYVIHIPKHIVESKTELMSLGDNV